MRVFSAIILVPLWIALSGLAHGQGDHARPPKGTLQGSSVAVPDLHLDFRFPPGSGPVRRSESKRSSGKRITQFVADQTLGIRCEISMIHERLDSKEENVWPLLERLVGNALRSSKARLVNARACWVDSMPAFRFQGTTGAGSTSQQYRIMGQFILAPDGIILAQTVAPTKDPSQKKQSVVFFNTVRRPGITRPKTYSMTMGPFRFSYPPGILPHFRDGFLHLETANKKFGILLRLQDTLAQESEIICALASSLDHMTKKPGEVVSLIRGPGLIETHPHGPKTHGFESRVKIAAKRNRPAFTKTNFVRYYEYRHKCLFVSAFALGANKDEPTGSARSVVQSVLDSFEVAQAAEPTGTK